MKKNVVNVIKIESKYSPEETENLLKWRFERAINSGYSLPRHDFYLYSAILIKQMGIENLPEKYRSLILQNGELEPEINFHDIRLKMLDQSKLSEVEEAFFNFLRKKKVNERKEIIKKEISRTKIKGKVLNTLNHKNSLDYKELLQLTREFSDITLLDWFIPIVLKYERLIHIFIRHVEQTKFAESQTLKRTFFSYEASEIWTLLKILIKQENESIKEHFIENTINNQLGKSYHRNSHNPIMYNGDRFSLSIDKNGFIMKFHQI